MKKALIITGVFAALVLLLVVAFVRTRRNPTIQPAFDLVRAADESGGEKIAVGLSFDNHVPVHVSAEACADVNVSVQTLRGLARDARMQTGALIIAGPVKSSRAGGWIVYLAANLDDPVRVDLSKFGHVDFVGADNGKWPGTLHKQAIGIEMIYSRDSNSLKIIKFIEMPLERPATSREANVENGAIVN